MRKLNTALLWGPDNLLTQAIEKLLTAEEMWAVIRISTEQGISSLMEQMQRTKPDLVIFYQDRRGMDADLVMSLLHSHPELRVITVSLENNVMQVYSKQSITVRHVSDLMAVIENGSFSGNPIGKEVDDGGKNN